MDNFFCLKTEAEKKPKPTFGAENQTEVKNLNRHSTSDVDHPGDDSTSIVIELAVTPNVHDVQHVRSATRWTWALAILAANSTLPVDNIRVIDTSFLDHKFVTSVGFDIKVSRQMTSYAHRDQS